jgi:hypothetical protein
VTAATTKKNRNVGFTVQSFWHTARLVTARGDYKYAVYKHLFEGMTLEKVGAEIGATKNNVCRVKKNFENAVAIARDIHKAETTES